jgi:hypothetical protein
MAAGIIATLQRMGAVVIAILLALPGLDFLLLQGEPVLGAGMLGMAAVVILVSEYVRTPTDVPAEAAQRAASAVAKDPDDEKE